MSLTGNAFIDKLYGYNHIFGKVNSTPIMATGQSAVVVSDGTIPSTIDGNIYLIPYGETPIDLTAGGGIAGANVGGGDGDVFRDIVGSTINLRTIADGTGINVATVGDAVVVNSTTAGANVGAGTGTIYRDGSGDTLNLRTIVAGTGITVGTAGDLITITNSSLGVGGYEDLATSAATDPDADIEITDMNLNTGTTVALTLADPTSLELGKKKKIIISRLTASSILDLTITTFVGGSGLRFKLLGMSCSLVWTAGGWAIDNAGADNIV